MTRSDRIEALLDRCGQTYCDELGIDIARNQPSPLYRWLTACVLFSAPISADQAVTAARALAEAGWTTAEKMADATWKERVEVLNANGYARYDESASRMLEDGASHLLDAYGGDLRKLRSEADRVPEKERKRLKEVKGIGDVGVDIFFREAQIAWDELFPFADKLALRAAKKLDLGDDARALAKRVKEAAYPRLVAALVRVELADDYQALDTA